MFFSLRVGALLRSAHILAIALLLVWPLLSPAAQSTQSTNPPPIPSLPLILITATRQPCPIANIPAAITVVDQWAIKQGLPSIALDETLNRVPGLFSQNSFNFAQDQRLSIRGFGTRAAFGIREIKLIVDGLPETSPDGQTEIDSLDLGSAQRIEVLRGPAASLYGNAAGGVINIVTEDGPPTPTL